MFIPVVITTILDNQQNQFIVYTDLEGTYKLFSELNFPNAIVLLYPTLKVLHTHAKKTTMINQLKTYHIESITFYHTEYGQLANWLIKKYSNKTLIYFQTPYETWDLKPIYDLPSIFSRLLTLVLYGYWADVLLVGTKRYLSMSKSFFERNKVIRIPHTVNNIRIVNYMKKVYNYNHSNSIVLLNGAVEAGGVDTEEYRKLTDQIITKLGKENIFSKCHPRYNDLYGLETELRQIPSYIPISLLLNCFDVYIGYWSTALVEAAKEGKKAISTIYIMPQKQSGRIEIERKILDDKLAGKGKILYPQTIEELFNIISEKS